MLSEKEKLILREEFPAIMDTEDVTRFLRISRRTLYRMMEDGTLNGWKDEDGEWNFARTDILEYLDKNCTI